MNVSAPAASPRVPAIASHLQRACLEAAANAIVITDRFGVIEWANPAFTRLTGYTPDEYVGLTPRLVKSGCQDEGYYREMWRTITAGRVWQGELLNRRKDGSVYVEDMTIAPVRDAAGTITHFIAVKQDITARREAEDALLRARNEAMAASQAKSAFLAMMSHELRTPLNGLLGSTELLFDANPTPEQREYLDIIRTSGRMLLGVIGDILDWSKIEAGLLQLEDEAFDPAELVGRILRTFQPEAARRQLALAVTIAPGVPGRIRGDQTRLGQVIFNLVGNALKFTPAGRVDVMVSAPVAHELQIDVRDTGIGIDPACQGSLFEAFTQADETTTRRYGGTGLGLAISRRLVTLMHGTLTVASQPGKGSTFTVTVPGEAEWPVRRLTIEPESTSDAAGRTHHLRVLIAEDNAINRRIAAAMLNKIGVTPEFAGDGHEAVACASHTAFDVILMDVQMPEMDGIEATRLIRAAGASTRARVVAVTAHATAEDRERCLAAGMDAYIAKPYRLVDLTSALYPSSSAACPLADPSPANVSSACRVATR